MPNELMKKLNVVIKQQVTALCPRGIIIADSNAALSPRSFGKARLAGDTLWHFNNAARQVMIQQVLYAIECAGEQPAR